MAKRVLDADAATVAAVKPWRKEPAVKALSWFSEIGDQPPLLALSSGVLVLGLASGRPRLARAGGRMIAAHLLATAAKNFVKKRVDRSRPREADGPGGHHPRRGRSEAKAKTSFPSGHSAGAIAVARALAREFPEQALPALGAAGLVAVAQVPRCAHYPTDVGAGIAIGILAEAAVGAVWPARPEER